MELLIKLLFLSTILSPSTCDEWDITEFEDALASLVKPNKELKQTENIRDSYDFIIVGCGTSGALLANRLSVLYTVLCLEAGQEESFLTDIPILTRAVDKTDYTWKYSTARQNGICEGFKSKTCPWARGKAVGGSTVTDFMLYSRGSPHDYDKWAKMGNKGWSYREILPYFKKFESVMIPEFSDIHYRGFSGELQITYPPYHSELAHNFVRAGNELGIPSCDINTNNTIGVSYVQTTQRRGRRETAAMAFLYPIRQRSNLHVVKKAFVTKVIIDKDKKIAYGVQFIDDGKAQLVNATKEVILSAGPLNSPKILLLSGVGPKKLLEKFGIPLIKNLPVGQRIQDQPVFLGNVVFLIDGANTQLTKDIILNLDNFSKYIISGEGPYTIPGGIEAYAFVNSRETSDDYPGLHDEVPDIGLLFPRDGSKSIPLFDEPVYKILKPISKRNTIRISIILLKPQSIGNMTLNSRDPFDPPIFYANYFDNEADLDHMLRGIRMAIKFAETKTLQKYHAKLYESPIPPCEEYNFNSDEYWKCALRQLTGSGNHQVGSCKMGRRNDKTAVVEPTLEVKGIKNLRVVDSSVIPEITSATMPAPAYMIAEKAADMIKSKWKKHGQPTSRTK